MGSCLNIVASALEFILFVPDVHDLARSGLEVLLELLKLSALFEKSLRGASALVLEDLFALEISALGPLHEFVPVVLVSDLQVVKSVCQSLDFLLALTNLAIELVTKPLELFLLLRSLDHEVGLSMFSIGLDVARARLVPLAKALVFDAQVLHLLLSHLQFISNLVTFLLSSLLLRFENVFVDLDFLFTLLHRHLKLVFAVLETVYTIGHNVHSGAQVLDLQLHDVVLDEFLLFLVSDFLKVGLS